MRVKLATFLSTLMKRAWHEFFANIFASNVRALLIAFLSKLMPTFVEDGWNFNFTARTLSWPTVPHIRMPTCWCAAYLDQAFVVAVFCSANVRTTVIVAVHEVHAKEFANVTVNSSTDSRTGVHSTVHDRFTLLFASFIWVMVFTKALDWVITFWKDKSL